MIGDGLYVYHRGKHAVDELKTKVDEYYPRIEAVDSVLMKTLSAESLPATARVIDTIPPEREVVRRNRKVIYR